MVATLLHVQMHFINIVNGVAAREKRRVKVLLSDQPSTRWVLPALLTLISTSCHEQLQGNDSLHLMS